MRDPKIILSLLLGTHFGIVNLTLEEKFQDHEEGTNNAESQAPMDAGGVLTGRIVYEIHTKIYRVWP